MDLAMSSILPQAIEWMRIHQRKWMNYFGQYLDTFLVYDHRTISGHLSSL